MIGSIVVLALDGLFFYMAAWVGFEILTTFFGVTHLTPKAKDKLAQVGPDT